MTDIIKADESLLKTLMMENMVQKRVINRRAIEGDLSMSGLTILIGKKEKAFYRSSRVGIQDEYTAIYLVPSLEGSLIIFRSSRKEVSQINT